MNTDLDISYETSLLTDTKGTGASGRGRRRRGGRERHVEEVGYWVASLAPRREGETGCTGQSIRSNTC